MPAAIDEEMPGRAGRRERDTTVRKSMMTHEYATPARAQVSAAIRLEIPPLAGPCRYARVGGAWLRRLR